MSVAHIDGEELALFSHGTAVLVRPGPEREEIDAHWSAHYGSSPWSWGHDIRLYRLQMSWVIAYAAHRDRLPASRHVIT